MELTGALATRIGGLRKLIEGENEWDHTHHSPLDIGQGEGVHLQVVVPK